MKKPSQQTMDVVTIFGRVLIGILIVFLFGILLLHYNISNNDDVYNWTSLTIEIGIGIGITWTVWKFSKRDQNKIKELIDEIKKMEDSQNTILNKQTLALKEKQSFLAHIITRELARLISSCDSVESFYQKWTSETNIIQRENYKNAITTSFDRKKYLLGIQVSQLELIELFGSEIAFLYNNLSAERDITSGMYDLDTRMSELIEDTKKIKSVSIDLDSKLRTFLPP